MRARSNQSLGLKFASKKCSAKALPIFGKQTKMSPSSSRPELILSFMFRASHTLSGYETPHPHYWTLQLAVSGEIVNGMIVDMVKLRSGVQTLIAPLEDKYLNDVSLLNPAARNAPTCETLSAYFSDRLKELLSREFLDTNSTLNLEWTAIAIHELDKTEMGRVRRG
jgi:6-pyruvoyl-tetrahydropterin synthase